MNRYGCAKEQCFARNGHLPVEDKAQTSRTFFQHFTSDFYQYVEYNLGIVYFQEFEVGLFNKMQDKMNNLQEKVMDVQDRINQNALNQMEESRQRLAERREQSQTNEESANTLSKAETKQLLAEKQRNETSIQVTICNNGGAIKTGMFDSSTIWKQSDGLIYFNKNPDDLYRVIGFDWDGPTYQEVTQTTSTSKNKTKRKGRVAGAVVGTAVLGPLGTAIGAGLGTGNKAGKGKTNERSVTAAFEVDSCAMLHLQNANTGANVHVGLSANSQNIYQLRDFLEIEQSEPASLDFSIDKYEELKKLKELLDMNIISNEEFEFKKNELLGL